MKERKKVLYFLICNNFLMIARKIIAKACFQYDEKKIDENIFFKRRFFREMFFEDDAISYLYIFFARIIKDRR